MPVNLPTQGCCSESLKKIPRPLPSSGAKSVKVGGLLLIWLGWMARQPEMLKKVGAGK